MKKYQGKARTTRVRVWGGYHNAFPVTVRVPSDRIPTTWTSNASWILDPAVTTEGQRAKLRRAMCGIKGCVCGPHHGWGWGVASKSVQNISHIIRAVPWP